MLKKIFKYFFLFVGGSAALVLLVAAVLVAVIAYGHYFPDKYKYWNELIAKDPKPMWVSEKEYREKLRAGYCWRDRKFYTPEELQQKAMVSFSGRLLGEAKDYRTDSIPNFNSDGTYYTSRDCVQNETACRVWFVPQDYTNRQWDKLLWEKDNQSNGTLLEKYLTQEIKQPADLQNRLIQYGNKGFTLYFRHSGNTGGDLYGSDCCKVLSRTDAAPKVKNEKLVTQLVDQNNFPKREIPKNSKIQDYGVGNFYFEFRMVVPGYQNNENNKTYQLHTSDILLMNNCGDVLWHPYYINSRKNEKD